MMNQMENKHGVYAMDDEALETITGGGMFDCIGNAIGNTFEAIYDRLVEPVLDKASSGSKWITNTILDALGVTDFLKWF